MDIRQINQDVSITGQIHNEDVALLKDQGFRTLVCNRPDGEALEQTPSADIAKAAEACGMNFYYLPITPGSTDAITIDAFRAIPDNEKPLLAYCRTGNRSSTLWALSQLNQQSTQTIVAAVKGVGFDFVAPMDKADANTQANVKGSEYDVVVVGGGAAGISTAASLKKRNPALEIAIIEPKEDHYYQPGWTMVGAGVFRAAQTARKTVDLIPSEVTWIRDAVTSFAPDNNQVTLSDGTGVNYRALIVAPGLKLDWSAIEGLSETLGQNGVTSNYQFEHAPYTWELVQKMKNGRAVFTQPPMPIKCAGAPQKALYLSCSHWEKKNYLQNIDVTFANAGGVLFGVEHYVPALQNYIDRYGVNLDFNRNLVAVDGVAGKAYFSGPDENNNKEVEFDFLHVCPPQIAPDFVRNSSLANEAGWVDVDQHTLQHVVFENVFSLGDAGSTPNAKTAAAVRQQAPVVAENLLAHLADQPLVHTYNGYGSCPLTVEHGKIVLAEFGYQAKLLPSLPKWIINGDKPSRLSWFLKKSMLPPIYFDLMLKGREWLARPKTL